MGEMKDWTDKTWLKDEDRKMSICEPLDAPYRPGAAKRRDVMGGSGSGGRPAINSGLTSPGDYPNKDTPKHFDILEAIDHLKHTVSIVQRLCNDIVGLKEVSEDGPSIITEPPSMEPQRLSSLIDVLEEAPDDIHSECKMIEMCINEIREQLRVF